MERGYILLARQLSESEVAHFPPCAREVWIWILRKAVYKPVDILGKHLKRGQVLTSYSRIQEDLHWAEGCRKMVYTKGMIQSAFRIFKRSTMATTRKTATGFIITVTKYDFYQDTENYKSVVATTPESIPMKKHLKTEKKEKKFFNKISETEKERGLRKDDGHAMIPLASLLPKL